MIHRALLVVSLLLLAACDNRDCTQFTDLEERANDGSARARLELAQRLADGVCTKESKVDALMWLQLVQSNALRVGEFARDGDLLEKANEEMGAFLLAVRELDNRLRGELTNPHIAEAETKADSWVTPKVGRLKQLAETGDTQAQFELALLYFAYDSNLPYDDGLPYLEMAAGQGHPQAAFMMGERYANPRLPINNLQTAFEWYQVATEGGHYLGRNALLLAHCEGKGVKRNLEQCYKWLAIHNSQRDNFPELLEPYWQREVVENLSDEEKQRAVEAAQQWVLEHPGANY